MEIHSSLFVPKEHENTENTEFSFNTISDPSTYIEKLEPSEYFCVNKKCQTFTPDRLGKTGNFYAADFIIKRIGDYITGVYCEKAPYLYGVILLINNTPYGYIKADELNSPFNNMIEMFNKKYPITTTPYTILTYRFLSTRINVVQHYKIIVESEFLPDKERNLMYDNDRDKEIIIPKSKSVFSKDIVFKYPMGFLEPHIDNKKVTFKNTELYLTYKYEHRTSDIGEPHVYKFNLPHLGVLKNLRLKLKTPQPIWLTFGDKVNMPFSSYDNKRIIMGGENDLKLFECPDGSNFPIYTNLMVFQDINLTISMLNKDDDISLLSFYENIEVDKNKTKLDYIKRDEQVIMVVYQNGFLSDIKEIDKEDIGNTNIIPKEKPFERTFHVFSDSDFDLNYK
jgi:hypothetical protein